MDELAGPFLLNIDSRDQLGHHLDPDSDVDAAESAFDEAVDLIKFRVSEPDVQNSQSVLERLVLEAAAQSDGFEETPQGLLDVLKIILRQIIRLIIRVLLNLVLAHFVVDHPKSVPGLMTVLIKLDGLSEIVGNLLRLLRAVHVSQVHFPVAQLVVDLAFHVVAQLALVDHREFLQFLLGLGVGDVGYLVVALDDVDLQLEIVALRLRLAEVALQLFESSLAQLEPSTLAAELAKLEPGIDVLGLGEEQAPDGQQVLPDLHVLLAALEAVLPDLLELRFPLLRLF